MTLIKKSFFCFGNKALELHPSTPQLSMFLCYYCTSISISNDWKTCLQLLPLVTLFDGSRFMLH